MPKRAASIETAVRTMGIGLILAGLLTGSRSVARDRTPSPSLAVLRGPLAFEPNRGQAEPSVRFLTDGPGYRISLTSTAAILSLRSRGRDADLADRARPLQPGPRIGANRSATADREEIRLQLFGANPSPDLVGRDRLPGHVNYLRGRDTRNWLTRIPTHARVRYREVYPGIDLEYYGAGGQLEFDFIVEPGADSSVIEFMVDGAARVALEDEDLVLSLRSGEIRLRRPEIYQLSAKAGADRSTREPISGGFVQRAGNRIGFELAAYDHARALVIDPRVVYSTYLGTGSQEFYMDVAADSDGNAYVVGTREVGVHFDGIVQKLSALGTGPMYTTLFQGTDGGGGVPSGADEYPLSIAVDANGNAYVAGQTNSENLPLVNAAQSSYGGSGDAFAAKLDPDGMPVYVTYLGGTDFDFGAGVDVDLAGNAYVTGFGGFGFPFTIATGGGGAFVTKFDPSGAVVHTVCAGCGSGFNQYTGADIAVDPLGQAHVTGYTGRNFLGIQSAFVTKLSSDGMSGVYQHIRGGTGADTQGFDIALDDAGNAYFTGQTFSSAFPTTAGAFQRVLDADSPLCIFPCSDAFVTKLDLNGLAVYSTYLGGSQNESGNGIAVDDTGRATVVGRTGSDDFPTRNPMQPGFAGGIQDIFVTRLAPDGSELSFSTYLGGSGVDGDSIFFPETMGIERYGSSNLLVAATTNSPDFPTQDASQPSPGGDFDGFVVSLFDQPVIFVPGAAGSVLIDRSANDEEIWVGTSPGRWRDLSLYPSDDPLNHDILAADPVREIAGLLPIYGPFLTRLADEGFVSYRLTDGDGTFVPERLTGNSCDLSQADGAVRPDLFPFPYDWRLDIGENADRLRDYVLCVQLFYPDTEISVVAHSMGSVISRRYVLDHSDDHGLNTVITVGGPFLGAPKLLYVLESGDFLPFRVGSKIFRDIAGSMPGLHQLAPSRSYFELASEVLGLAVIREKDRDLNGDGLLQALTYDEATAFVDAAYGREGFAPGSANSAFHTQEQDDWSGDATGIQYRHILGRKAAFRTIGGLVATTRIACRLSTGLLPLRCPVKPVIEPVFTVGDGTVPSLSAERIGGTTDLNAPDAEVLTFASSSPAEDDLVDHTGMMGNPEVQDQILQWLRGGLSPAVGSAAVGVQVTAPIPPYRYTTISGVDDVIVEDESGNSTALVDGVLHGIVPGVDVIEIGEDVFLVATPESAIEEYRITFQSTVDPMSVEIRLGTPDTTTRAVRFNDIDLPAGTAALVTLAPAAVQDLRYDADDDQTFETVVPPSADVSGAPAQDTDGPSIAIVVTPEAGVSRRVTLLADDPESGVAALFYSFNGLDYQAYTDSFSVNPLATPFVTVFAEDGVANRSTRVLSVPEPHLDILVLSALTALATLRNTRRKRPLRSS